MLDLERAIAVVGIDSPAAIARYMSQNGTSMTTELNVDPHAPEASAYSTSAQAEPGFRPSHPRHQYPLVCRPTPRQSRLTIRWCV